jgi:fermentation-respiration switch protein FrsA (DUF1100 family)
VGWVFSSTPTLVWAGLFMFGAFLYNLHKNQNALLYHPVLPGAPQFRRTSDNPPPYSSPADWGMPFEDVYMTTADRVRIHAWLVKAPPSLDHASAPTVVFFHANAGNLGFRLPNLKVLHDAVKVNVLIFDYRGYGNSEGTPDEPGLQLDGDVSAAARAA